MLDEITFALFTDLLDEMNRYEVGHFTERGITVSLQSYGGKQVIAFTPEHLNGFNGVWIAADGTFCTIAGTNDVPVRAWLLERALAKAG